MGARLFELPESLDRRASAAAASGYKLRFFLAGIAQQEPVFMDAALKVRHAQPIVVTGAGGYPPIYLDTSRAYLVDLSDLNDVSLPEFPIDNMAAVGWVRTPKEIEAGVKPANYFHRPGNVVRYGATGDGVTDDTVNIHKALKSHPENVYFPRPRSKYMAGVLNIPSDCNILLEPGTVISAVPSLGKFERVFYMRNVENIVITGHEAMVTMEGRFKSGEFRHCVEMRGARNVWIYGLACDAAGGDGFLLGWVPESPYCDNIHLTDVSANANRRQGLSIVSGRNIHIIRPRFTNTSGTLPSAGIDIEPNANDTGHKIENINIVDAYTEGNDGVGIAIELRHLATGEDVSIQINRHRDWKSAAGISIGAINLSSKNVSGRITITDSHVSEPAWAGIIVQNFDSSGPRVIIDSPVIVDCNHRKVSAEFARSAVAIFRDGKSPDIYTIGNVKITNLEARDTRRKAQMDRALLVRDISVSDPTRVEKVTVDGIKFSWADARKTVLDAVDFQGAGVVEDAAGNLTYSLATRTHKHTWSAYVRHYNNTGQGAARKLILDERTGVSAPPLTVTVTEPHSIDINCEGGDVISLPAGGALKSLSSRNTGDTITLRKLATGHWIVSQLLGFGVDQSEEA
jgi:hypothetical protein